jgi:hypothetical protein
MSDWVDEFLAATTPHLALARPKQLHAFIVAAARLRLRPSPAWWAAAGAAAAPHLARGRLPPRALAELLAAAALAGAPPSDVWAVLWVGEMHRALPDFPPRSLVKAAWAAARMRLRLPVPLKVALASAAAAPGLVQALTPEDLVQLPWALVQLHVWPGRELSDRVALQLGRRCRELSAPQLARAAWAVARLWTPPRAALVAFLVEGMEARAAELGLDLAAVEVSEGGGGGGESGESGASGTGGAGNLGLYMQQLRQSTGIPAAGAERAAGLAPGLPSAAAEHAALEEAAEPRAMAAVFRAPAP